MPKSKRLTKLAQEDHRIQSYRHHPGDSLGEHWVRIDFGYYVEPNCTLIVARTVPEAVKRLRNSIATEPQEKP